MSRKFFNSSVGNSMTRPKNPLWRKKRKRDWCKLSVRIWLVPKNIHFLTLLVRIDWKKLENSASDFWYYHPSDQRFWLIRTYFPLRINFIKDYRRETLIRDILLLFYRVECHRSVGTLLKLKIVSIVYMHTGTIILPELVDAGIVASIKRQIFIKKWYLLLIRCRKGKRNCTFLINLPTYIELSKFKSNNFCMKAEVLNERVQKIRIIRYTIYWWT